MQEVKKDSVPAAGDPAPAAATTGPVDETCSPAVTDEKTKKDWKFWLIFFSLVLTAFLSALEGSVVSTALPSIARALDASENYVWVVNVYYLAKYVATHPFGLTLALLALIQFPLRMHR